MSGRDLYLSGNGYAACDRHARALARMEFERALDVATACPDCATWTGVR